jgi:hypothetical protein
MLKKLTKHENSLALVIDRPILDLLKIDPETPLDVSTDGKRLIIAPAGFRLAGRSSMQPRSRHISGTARPSRSSLSERPPSPMEPLFLSLDEVLEIHQQQIQRYSGSAGIRDPAGLESAIDTPATSRDDRRRGDGWQFCSQRVPALIDRDACGVWSG